MMSPRKQRSSDFGVVCSCTPNMSQCDSHASRRRSTKELSRRRVLSGCVTAATGLAGVIGVGSVPWSAQALGNAAPAISRRLDTTVQKIERIHLNVPFRDVPSRHMVRTTAINWTYVEVCKVTLGCGVVGIGEVVQYFVERRGEDRQVLGRDAS